MDRWTKKERKVGGGAWPCLLCSWQASLSGYGRTSFSFSPVIHGTWSHLTRNVHLKTLIKCQSTYLRTIYFMLLFFKTGYCMFLQLFLSIQELYWSFTKYSPLSWLIYLSKLIGQPALPRVQMKSGHASHYLVKPVQGADLITQMTWRSLLIRKQWRTISVKL